MHVYQTRKAFDAELSSVKKWVRCGQALDLASGLQRDVAYSIGDSLVYWWDEAASLAASDFVGHRRYLSVLSPIDGGLAVEIAPKSALQAIKPYSDLTDRERFAGAGERTVVQAGGVLVVDIDEAFRIPADQRVKAVVIHVTVEGYSFPNK